MLVSCQPRYMRRRGPGKAQKNGKYGKDFPTSPQILGCIISDYNFIDYIAGYVLSVRNYCNSYGVAIMSYGVVVSACLSFFYLRAQIYDLFSILQWVFIEIFKLRCKIIYLVRSLSAQLKKCRNRADWYTHFNKLANKCQVSSVKSLYSANHSKEMAMSISFFSGHCSFFLTFMYVIQTSCSL